MQAVEFKTQPHNGMIKLPSKQSQIANGTKTFDEPEDLGKLANLKARSYILIAFIFLSIHAEFVTCQRTGKLYTTRSV
jgi:hypothetical protein